MAVLESQMEDLWSRRNETSVHIAEAAAAVGAATEQSRSRNLPRAPGDAPDGSPRPACPPLPPAWEQRLPNWKPPSPGARAPGTHEPG